MEIKHQVFVSSTYKDLVEERKTVIHALLELDCIPAGMELFPAADEDAWAVIKGVIDECDYYILILAGKYGSSAPNGIGYTEMEFDYAVSTGKPILGFLHQEPDCLPAGNVEKTEQLQAKLAAFREKARSKHCKFWTSADDLGGKVSRSLTRLRKMHPSPGWIPGRFAASEHLLTELQELRNKLRELELEASGRESTTQIDLEQLAQGDDPISVRFVFGAYQSTTYKADFEHEGHVATTWNRLFAAISPTLVNEASETSIRSTLSEFVFAEAQPMLKNEKRLKGFTLKNPKVKDDDFHTVKVQFLALSLLTKSRERKSRSVNDRETYWTLTQRGENLMTILRAVRRNTHPAPSQPHES